MLRFSILAKRTEKKPKICVNFFDKSVEIFIKILYNSRIVCPLASKWGYKLVKEADTHEGYLKNFGKGKQ